MLKTLILVLVAVLLAGVGHVMLAKGMKTVGDLTEAPTSRLSGMVGRVFASPWVLFGIVFQAGFFFMYLTLLSRVEVSWVLPVTAADYIVVVLLAQYLLAEAVTPSRWAGVGLIVVGVALVSRT
jgi:drug/metabolite transporter (DMT)-like permease